MVRGALLLLGKVWILALWRISVPLLLWLHGVQTGYATRFVGIPVISLKKGSSITIGSKSRLVSASRFTALGVPNPVILRTMRPGARISIGDRVGISGSVITAASSIIIEDDVLIGSGVIITDTDFHSLLVNERGTARDIDYAKTASVRICSGAFIGARAIILKGTRVGENSIIGAGAVVTHDVPDNSIVAGNPARLIGEVGSPGLESNSSEC